MATTPATRHDAVWEWLLQCPFIGDLFFNSSRAEDGNTQLVPSESIAEEYIDGSKLMNYDVALTRVQAMSNDPNDTTNLELLVDFEQVAAWIDQNLPVFPDGYTVCSAECQPSMSGFVAAQDMESGKYMIQFRVQYIH